MPSKTESKRRFDRIDRLPPYILAEVTDWKDSARRAGEDVIDFGMGNPDMATPPHIVEKLIDAARLGKNHRYSASRGIRKLRVAICDWAKRRFGVELDPDEEAIVTIGSKEGLSHLMFAIISPGDSVIVPTPTYSIHSYSVVIANGDALHVPIGSDERFFDLAQRATDRAWPRPKVLMLNFPANPTTLCVGLDFFERAIEFARANDLLVIHDNAYSEITFDGYVAPSILQVPGAKEIAVEIYSLSKTFAMPGWRVGFVCGSRELVTALRRLKGYLDYGMFQPIQIASVIALNGSTEPIEEIRSTYRNRRDVLCSGLNRIGWEIEPPRGTMFVWAPIPADLARLGSMEFARKLLEYGKVAVSPGIGFGDGGDGHVRFALVENENRIRQAVRGARLALTRMREEL